MAFEFRLPDIGEGVVEGEIVSWKVTVGKFYTAWPKCLRVEKRNLQLLFK